MPLQKDKYINFAELISAEPRAAWRALAERRSSSIAIIAPHGGGIERGTSEVARAVAGEESSLYLFEGLKANNNDDLHITSASFDEPVCLALVESSDTVVAMHGAQGAAPLVFIGGLDGKLGDLVQIALVGAGFDVRDHPRLKGKSPENICNRGRSGRGLQLELTMGLRQSFFANMSTEGRQRTTAGFRAFVAALRQALARR